MAAHKSRRSSSQVHAARWQVTDSRAECEGQQNGDPVVLVGNSRTTATRTSHHTAMMLTRLSGNVSPRARATPTATCRSSPMVEVVPERAQCPIRVTGRARFLPSRRPVHARRGAGQRQPRPPRRPRALPATEAFQVLMMVNFSHGPTAVRFAISGRLPAVSALT